MVPKRLVSSTPGSSFSEVFLRNTCLGQGSNCEQGTTFVAYGPGSGPGANGGAACGPGAGPSGYSPYRGDQYPAIDTTGRYVAFVSDACQFAGISFTNSIQLYLRDLSGGSTSLVSVDSTGSPLSSGITPFSGPYAMSTNPAFLAFAYQTTSPSVVLGVGNPSAYNEIYWTNVCTAQSPSPCTSSTVLVSQDSTNPNTIANNTAEEPSISADGRYVAFASTATNLVSGVTIPTGSEQVYLRDTCPSGASGCTGTILISKDNSGNVASGTNPSVSSGGRFVAFVSSDTSLETGVTTSSAPQIYLRDTLNNTTTLLSQLNGKAGNGTSGLPFISADGRLITFTSASSDLNSADSSLSAIYEYDTCFNAPSPCTAGLYVIHPTTTGQVEEGALVDVVDATNQFDTFNVVNTSSGYPLTQVYVGETTVVAPQPNPTATALALSPGSLISFGTPVTLTATVTSSGAPVTSGSVVFSDKNGMLATVPLNSSGQAIYLVPGLVPGSYTLTASYGGASGYSTSSAVSAPPLTVTLAQSTTVLTPSAPSINAGQTLTLTAVVSIPGGTVAPTGSVAFYKGTTFLGLGTTKAGPSGSLTQTFSVPNLAVQAPPYTFEASYLGDSNYEGSDSNAVQVTVTTASSPPPPASVMVMETITVTDTPTFPDVADNEPINVTDTVKVVACGTIMISPSGTLPGAAVGSSYMQQFSAVGGTSPYGWAIGGAPSWLTIIAGTGVLSGTPPTGSAGAYPFTVTVTDANGCPGSANVSLPVMRVPPIATTTTIMATSSTYQGLALPANFALVDNPVTVNFNVAPASGTATATGSVKVADGVSPSTDNCSVALAAGAGSCAVTISQLGTGSTPLTAAYSPDATATALGLQASTSTPVTEDVVEITSCGTPPSIQTAAQGTVVTFTFSTCLATTVLATPNSNGVVTGCPPNATCTATTNPVSGKLGVYTVVVTIVPGGAGQGAPRDDRRPWGQPLPLTLFGFGLLLATLMALKLARQKRARPRLAYAAGFVIALTLLLSGLHGCASNGVPNTFTVHTPPNTYIVHVTITAGNYSVTVPLTLNVTN